MPRDRFPLGVAEQLKWYVYRLIDPRNGEIFYVGKGTEDRIFEHAKGDSPATGDEDALDLKFQRIKEIRTTALEVGHLIHRHGIDEDLVAYEVEAALIDAYPGLTNKVRGHGSGDYGCRYVEEVVAEYAAESFKVGERLIMISIGLSYQDEGRDVYEAARYAWKVNVKRARGFRLVLAHSRGVVVGAFRPKTRLEATKANFPGLDSDIQGRWRFDGEPAESATWENYVKKRVPDRYRAKGAANPIRFVSL